MEYILWEHLVYSAYHWYFYISLGSCIRLSTIYKSLFGCKTLGDGGKRYENAEPLTNQNCCDRRSRSCWIYGTSLLNDFALKCIFMNVKGGFIWVQRIL